jgi:hypothetical protein
MDAKVVRITMIPKAFTRSKKRAYPVYRAALLADAFAGSILYQQD